jgi:chromosome partitioning protein
MESYYICSNKGGVGKTTITYNIATGLAKLGKKVLLLDLDIQASLTYYVGAKIKSSGVAHVIAKPSSFKDAIIHMDKNLDFLSGGDELRKIESTIEKSNDPKKYLRLKKLFEDHAKEYDYIICDGRPDIYNHVSILSAMACQYAIIPLEPSDLSYQGYLNMHKWILRVKKEYGAQIVVDLIVLNKYDKRTKVSKQIHSVLQKKVDGRLVTIRTNNHFNTCSNRHMDIYEFENERMKFKEIRTKRGVDDFKIILRKITQRGTE